MPVRLEDYNVSPTHGFLPDEAPLDVLSDVHYKPWETIIKNLPALILSRRLRQVVDQLPVLSTKALASDAEWRRAHSILAFTAHAYIWSGDRPCERVPPSVSIPFISTCNRLELPTVATYAAVVLWNYKPLFSDDEPLHNLQNLSTLTTYTGAMDESWFYLVSVAIEARGAPTIPLMLEAIDAVNADEPEIVVECLRTFAERLDELCSLLQRMYENCSPDFFYHRLRPFLAGSKNMSEAGLPNGVIFDTGHHDDGYVQFSGGSNAQSSIIQFFDIILGIEHHATGQTASSKMHQGPSENFIKDIRTYMPGPHGRFLEHVESIANMREYVETHQQNRSLVLAFDSCLGMLHAFRDRHIQMVSRYIIVPSRQGRTLTNINNNKVNLASATDALQQAGRPGATKGTGGTKLIPFLKQARDETGAPALDAWARRLLGPAGSHKMGRAAFSAR